MRLLKACVGVVITLSLAALVSWNLHRDIQSHRRHWSFQHHVQSVHINPQPTEEAQSWSHGYDELQGQTAEHGQDDTQGHTTEQSFDSATTEQKPLSEPAEEHLLPTEDASPPFPTASLSPPPAAQCAAQAGDAGVELDGDVVVNGIGKGSPQVSSRGECCAACASTAGCNVWVFCSRPGAWCANQCWLKHVDDPRQPPSVRGQNTDWTSGVLLKDFDDGSLDATVPDPAITHVAIKTPYGPIEIKLHPEWAPDSVAYVRKVVQTQSCTVKCEFYRSEPGFLLQGGMRAVFPANKVTTPGPVMSQGMVGWAGGSSGPDFFIYMAPVNATSWNHDHTVWGKVENSESISLVRKILKEAPAGVEKPGAMRMLDDNMKFSIEDASSYAQ